MRAIFEKVTSAGTTYVFENDEDEGVIFDYWFASGVTCYVALQDGTIAGMYKLIPNQCCRRAHVANASFMVDPDKAGCGIGKALGRYCFNEARRAGFKAIQFNFVVSTITIAISLLKSLGMTIVGTIPDADRHEKLGYVDAHIMHRFLRRDEVF